MELLAAHDQWRTRPADERFESLESLLADCQDDKENCVNRRIKAKDIKVDEVDGDVKLVGRGNAHANFTNFSFTQFCRYIGCPASFIPTLSSSLASAVINYRLGATIEERSLQDDDGKAFYMKPNSDGSIKIRAMVGDGYQRIHDYDIVSRLFDFRDDGWRIPPARPVSENFPGSRVATEQDCLEVSQFAGLGVKPGDIIAPAGLYRGDRNMFCFMVDESKVIDDGSDGGLCRGFFVENSEVGDRAFKVTMFMYRAVCGNHIVWDASNVTHINLRHTKNVTSRAMKSLQVDLINWANESTSEQEAIISRLQSFEIAQQKEDVIDFIFTKMGGLIGKRQASDIYDTGVMNADEDGNPKRAWGFINAITRYSQTKRNMDERNKLDAAAGQLIDIFRR
jgi:hypothetical protein